MNSLYTSTSANEHCATIDSYDANHRRLYKNHPNPHETTDSLKKRGQSPLAIVDKPMNHCHLRMILSEIFVRLTAKCRVSFGGSVP